MSRTRPTIRNVAARFVEHGRLMGEAEATERLAKELARLPIDTKELSRQAAALYTAADRARRDAEALLDSLEHPGARLGRRVVLSLRAALTTWRRAP